MQKNASAPTATLQGISIRKDIKRINYKLADGLLVTTDYAAKTEALHDLQEFAKKDRKSASDTLNHVITSCDDELLPLILSPMADYHELIGQEELEALEKHPYDTISIPANLLLIARKQAEQAELVN